MPKVSVNILTYNRAGFLAKALSSISAQTFKDFEVILINNASTDNTVEVLNDFQNRGLPIWVINMKENIGITKARAKALENSSGEYIAILDDDDQWFDPDKLKKQVSFFDNHPDCVLIGGGIEIVKSVKCKVKRFRPETDTQIRRTMLLRNNFFTSTVMFKKSAAVEVGGFINDGVDLAEDYDLWLRLGEIGPMHNFLEIFANYKKNDYPPEKLKLFLRKQLKLVNLRKHSYPNYWLAKPLLTLRSLL